MTFQLDGLGNDASVFFFGVDDSVFFFGDDDSVGWFEFFSLRIKETSNQTIIPSLPSQRSGDPMVIGWQSVTQLSP